MDGEKYDIEYYDFHCPLCRADISTESYFRVYEKGSYDYVVTEGQKKMAHEKLIIEHYKHIHGVDFPERAKND